MKIGKSNGVQKCKHCLRKKQEAINEQVTKMKVCENPSCPFRNEIQDAIRIKQEEPLSKFGIPKPSFTFGTKTKK